MCKSIEDRIIGGMFGLAVGEAEAIAPDGADQKSWSRSTGLCLCTADGFLCEKNYGGVMQNFADFTENLKFVPPEKNFYIGDDVAAAIEVYKNGGKSCKYRAGTEDNGYGSVVRMIPVAIYLGEIDFLECELGHQEMKIIHDTVRIINNHSFSIVACSIYVTIGRLLLGGFSTDQSIYEALKLVSRYYSGSPVYRSALLELRDLYNMDIFRLLPEAAIFGSENSVRTVEAAIWCLINSENYEDCVRMAKKLGGASDVVCSAAGGLAGLCYGFEGIPEGWIRRLKSQREIKEVSKKMAERFK